MNWRERRLHLVGIGGAGMSGLALVAHRLGAAVTGSDRSESSYTERLCSAGIEVAIGHAAANVPEGAEIVVSSAIGEDNPEVVRARELGLTIMHRSDLLAELVAAKPRCIAVAGTHGKTTTTAMIAHVLAELGADPAFFIGGEARIGGNLTNAGWGEGETVVVEADESDRSFLKLTPSIAVVTNVELDHHSTWGGGFDELLGAFAQFVAPARECVLWRGQARLAEIAPPERVVGFGIEPDAVRGAREFVARDVEIAADPARGATFKLVREDRELEVTLAVRGRHNVLNALAALAALERAGCEPERAVAALATFKGVARRFEFVGQTAGGVRLYDDYAHHPTEVRATLETARQSAGGGRVVAVFQPHLYSRTASLAREFGRALALADEAVILDVYPARESAEDFPGVTGWMVATATADARPGMRVLWQPSVRDAITALRRELRDGDLCITIGAGDVFKVAHALAERGSESK